MNRRRTWFRLVAPTIGALAGCLYWSMFDNVGTLAGSIVRGTFVGSLILFYERKMLPTGWRNCVRRAPTPAFAIATLATYAAMMITRSGFFYSFAASALVIFVLRIRDLIGP